MTGAVALSKKPGSAPATVVLDPKVIVEVRDLHKQYLRRGGFWRGQRTPINAVSGVSFSLLRGETLALVGESGCGKTTTGRCILRAVEPTAGELIYQFEEGAPQDALSLDPGALRRARRNIRMVFQDPYSSLNARMTLFEIISEPLIINNVARNRAALRDRVADLLRMVQLDPAYMNRYPHAFSGGQRQRIAIARALALAPKVIVADEPVSALDVSVQAQLLNLMKELQSSLGLTYLLVAHNLGVVKYVSDRVAVMYAGKIVELTETEQLFTAPRHPYTEALIGAVPKPDPRAKGKRLVMRGEAADLANLPSGCSFHTRCRYAQDRCRAETPQLRKISADGEQHLAACHFAEQLALRGI